MRLRYVIIKLTDLQVINLLLINHNKQSIGIEDNLKVENGLKVVLHIELLTDDQFNEILNSLIDGKDIKILSSDNPEIIIYNNDTY